MRTLFVCAAAALFMVCAAAEIPEVVTVTGGKIRGTTDDGVRAFKGIRYGASTAGQNRWRPPQPVPTWNGIRNATEFGPDCPQLDYPKASIYWREPRPQSEDCLSLNVWSEAASADERRPVMVWIHGGALTRGSGATPAYNGANLAKKGVVVVTVNYRLNVFGYLAHPELSAESEHDSSGNYGVLDQIAALQWVQNNIKTFGGDPNNVTIFGESAGSWSVCALQATPLSEGLFHRVIGQSGGVFSAMPYLKGENLGQRSQEAVGVAFGEALGDSSLNTMRDASVDDILKTFDEGAGFVSRASVDGWVFPEEVRLIFANGKQHDVPVMVGSNAKEMTTLTSPASIPRTMSALRSRIEQQYGGAADAFHLVYPATSDAEAGEAYLAGARDAAFTWQMRTWARMMENVSSPAYWYYFTRVPQIPNRDYLGAYHAAEIMYAFDNIEPSGDRFDETDVRVAEYISNYWVNFAKTGNPNGAGLTQWEPYSPETEPYMELGDEPVPGNNLLQAQLDFIEEIQQARLAGGGR